MLLCRAMQAARCTHACLLGWRTGAGGTWRHSGLFDLPYPALPACICFFIFRRALGEAGQGDLFSSFLYLGKRALYLRSGLVVAGAGESLEEALISALCEVICTACHCRQAKA